MYSPNIFCYNILSTSIVIHLQSAENRDKFFKNIYQRVQISGKYRRNYQDITNSLWAIRHQLLGQNVLGLNSCATNTHTLIRKRTYPWKNRMAFRSGYNLFHLSKKKYSSLFTNWNLRKSISMYLYIWSFLFLCFNHISI